MTLQQDQRPAWVIEQSLDWKRFDCCGDQDPFPLRCASCHHPMVFCCECDTIYADLPDTTLRSPVFGDWICPKCNSPIKNIVAAPEYRIGFDEWSNAGLDSLLEEPALDDLIQLMVSSADQIASYLRRGMRSTAKTRLMDFRNLAEAISHHFHIAAESRAAGSRLPTNDTLRNAIEHCDSIADPICRSYTILGVADVLPR